LIIGAIGQSAGLAQTFGTSAPTLGQAESGGDGFGAILKNFTESTINAIQNGEKTAIDAIQGKASIQSAVMATMEAEQSLQAAIAIRDKVVSAFLEISRMQI
jgi:flagellar hook-basal body complex protein FliE